MAENFVPPSSARRLRALSAEVSRVADTLARISESTNSDDQTSVKRKSGRSDLEAATVRKVIAARRLRKRYLPDDIFADPGWDILLDLLAAEIGQYRVPVSDLCLASAVPTTTGLRWVKLLEKKGLLVRHPDPHDGRRVFIELSQKTSEALRDYFADVEDAAAI